MISSSDQQVVIAAGSDQGIKEDTPIVTQDGLVGRVTDVTGSAAHVTLLTDEISYIRRDHEGYHACGTPFAGELAPGLLPPGLFPGLLSVLPPEPFVVPDVPFAVPFFVPDVATAWFVFWASFK